MQAVVNMMATTMWIEEATHTAQLLMIMVAMLTMKDLNGTENPKASGDALSVRCFDETGVLEYATQRCEEVGPSGVYGDAI